VYHKHQQIQESRVSVGSDFGAERTDSAGKKVNNVLDPQIRGIEVLLKAMLYFLVDKLAESISKELGKHIRNMAYTIIKRPQKGFLPFGKIFYLVYLHVEAVRLF
jgi:hypothetical protein